MKMLRNKNESSINFNIAVELICYDSTIESSVISADKAKVDPQSLADYLAFIDEAVLELEDHDLIILEKSGSKSSLTSKYFTLADLEQNVIGDMKFVIFLRISNHLPTTDEDVLDWIRKKRKDTADKLKVKWKVRNIIVNNETFDDYDSAIEYIGYCAERYQKSIQ